MDTARGTLTPRRRWVWPAPAEIALAACLVGLAVLTAVIADGDEVAGEAEPSTWWQWALVVSPAVPVAFRRVAPMIATPFTVVAQMVLWGIGLATAFFAPLVMIYTVAAEAGHRGLILARACGVALCLMALIGVFAAPDVTADLFVFTALASALAYLLGSHAARSRAEAVHLAEELATARVERDVAQERAAADERQRIARELHDIVGHSLSVIAVRAEAADRVASKNPDASVDAVAAIAASARSSLADVRRVLAGMREWGGTAELAPLPSLGSVPGLVASMAETGLEAELVGEIPPDDAVGAAVGAGAYRIVQEALTNVLKHAGAQATATVRIEADDRTLRLSVTDDGRGSSSNLANEQGFGLAGMRERAEVLGGRFESGHRPGGGFRVAVELPLDGSAADRGTSRATDGVGTAGRTGAPRATPVGESQ